MLPDAIKRTAYMSGEEYAWPKQHLTEALTYLSKNGYAVIGGEVWAVKDKKIAGILPCKDGSTGVFHWDVKGKRQNESWDEFCLRSKTEMLQAISELAIESDVIAELTNYLFYNICFVTQAEYAELYKSSH